VKQRILIVEDDATLLRVLRDNLAFEGFDVEAAATARDAVTKARAAAPDLVVLDAMLPDGDGFELCGLLRAGGATSVIMLSARSQKTDKVRGLAGGADDYVTKPFDFDELLARIHAVLRRARPSVVTLTLGEVLIDFRTMRASRGGVALSLTYREFELLRYLAEREGRPVSRDELLRHIWSFPDAPLTRLVDHAIARLRRKLEDNPRAPRFIRSAHGAGYCLTPSGQDPDSGR